MDEVRKPSLITSLRDSAVSFASMNSSISINLLRISSVLFLISFLNFQNDALDFDLFSVVRLARFHRSFGSLDYPS